MLLKTVGEDANCGDGVDTYCGITVADVSIHHIKKLLEIKRLHIFLVIYLKISRSNIFA